MKIQELQLILAIPRALETIMYFINAFLLYKKYDKLDFKERPQLNKLFFLGMMGWVVYIGLDVIYFLVAPLSLKNTTSAELIVLDYYPREYPSLILANILRDIALLGVFLNIWTYFIASYSIRYGAAKTKKIFLENNLVKGFMLVYSILFVGFDTIQVSINQTGIRTQAKWTGASGLSLFLTLAAYFISALLMYRALKIARKEEKSKFHRRRLVLLTIGVFLMGFGNLFWFLAGTGLIFSKYPVIVPQFVGHFIWLASPVFIYLGLKKPKNGKTNPPH